MKILCVEDGSIDMEGLEKEPLQDGKILVYRNGAKPPFVLEISENECNETEIRADERRKVCQEIREKAFVNTFEVYGENQSQKEITEYTIRKDKLDKIEEEENK